jgi:hypothetical protein
MLPPKAHLGFLDEGNSKEFPALKISQIFSDPKLNKRNKKIYGHKEKRDSV